jgi:hypothetical protein
MRVGHGGPRITQEDDRVHSEDAKNQTRRGSPAAGPKDTVQISSEARDLHSGRTQRAGDANDVSRLADARLDGVRSRIESGFYDSREVESGVSEALLVLYGL